MTGNDDLHQVIHGLLEDEIRRENLLHLLAGIEDRGVVLTHLVGDGSLAAVPQELNAEIGSRPAGMGDAPVASLTHEVFHP